MPTEPTPPSDGTLHLDGAVHSDGTLHSDPTPQESATPQDRQGLRGLAGDGDTDGQTASARVTIVVLTEEALGSDDAARIAALHPDETPAYRVLVPADTERNLLFDVIDHLSLFELREAVSAVRGGDDPAQARADAEQALEASVTALTGIGSADSDDTADLRPGAVAGRRAVGAAGLRAVGEVTADDPLPALAAAVDRFSAREVIVVTRPHAVADTVHRDWASRAREELGVPVLHLYAGSGRLG